MVLVKRGSHRGALELPRGVVSALVRGGLVREEKKRYRQQLSNILDHISKLQELDTRDVPPMGSMAVEPSRLREDVPGSAMPREDLLRHAPDVSDDQFRGP